MDEDRVLIQVEREPYKSSKLLSCGLDGIQEMGYKESHEVSSCVVSSVSDSSSSSIDGSSSSSSVDATSSPSSTVISTVSDAV
jgi:hypothetical protein